jgi:hypothetical protein
VGRAAVFVSTVVVNAAQNAVAPTPPSLSIARRQLSALQPVGSKAIETVCNEAVLKFELLSDVDVGDEFMEL